jgi:hypothetical protein
MGTRERGDRLPFGSPDGDRSDFDDAIDDFISFRDRRFKRGLGMNMSDRRARVIVGRKGAGKTLYLRRLQDAAKQENSLYADEWQASMFSSDNVLIVDEWYSRSQAIEKWEAIWRIAILRSLVAHLLCASDIGPFDLADKHALSQDFKVLYPHFTEKESVYAQVIHILDCYKNSASLDRHLSDRHWPALEQRLAAILTVLKPVCFYLDALDEYFEHAPSQWLTCQLGLFQAVMTFLRDPRFGARLHIVIGVRDIVFSSRLASEHKTKYIETDYIRTLNWDRDAVNQFLDQKLEALDPEYLMQPDAKDPIERWLGRKTIENARGKEEDLRQYLLRHTRLIPRDIVVLGNVLCKVIDKVADFDQPFLADEDIRGAVRRAAREFGEESLMMVANHLTADEIPIGAVEDGYANVLTGEDKVEHGRAYQERLADALAELLSTLKYVRFSSAVLEKFEKWVQQKTSVGNALLDILWQHGLLGYMDGAVRTSSVMFYDAASGDDSMKLPRGHKGYALHPILIDTIPRLKGSGSPVGAG